VSSSFFISVFILFISSFTLVNIVLFGRFNILAILFYPLLYHCLIFYGNVYIEYHKIL